MCDIKEVNKRKLNTISYSDAENNQRCPLVVAGVIAELYKQQCISINAKDGVGALRSLHAYVLHSKLYNRIKGYKLIRTNTQTCKICVGVV